jgi:hypothetical protein
MEKSNKSNEGLGNEKETKRKAEVATAGMKRKASRSWVEVCGLRLLRYLGSKQMDSWPGTE